MFHFSALLHLIFEQFHEVKILKTSFFWSMPEKNGFVLLFENQFDKFEETKTNLNMKTLSFFSVLLLVLLISCSQSPVEKLISDFEQTNGNTKTDMSFKVKKLELIKKKTVQDILNQNVLTLRGLLKTGNYSDQALDTLNFTNVGEFMTYQVNSFTRGGRVLGEVEGQIYNSRKQLKSVIDNFVILNSYYLSRDTAEVIEYRYKCTYSIKNPFMNGITQEITNIYLIDSDLTKIIKKEEN